MTRTWYHQLITLTGTTGSGTVGVLNVAVALAKFKVKNAVRFGFWSAEEFGKLGSHHYVKTLNGTISGNAQEIGKIRAYLNFDMMAKTAYFLHVLTPTRDAQLSELCLWSVRRFGKSLQSQWTTRVCGDPERVRAVLCP
jgi:Zn-dependent M28 family amino/carboxypeptidase